KRSLSPGGWCLSVPVACQPDAAGRKLSARNRSPGFPRLLHAFRMDPERSVGKLAFRSKQSKLLESMEFSCDPAEMKASAQVRNFQITDAFRPFRRHHGWAHFNRCLNGPAGAKRRKSQPPSPP